MNGMGEGGGGADVPQNESRLAVFLMLPLNEHNRPVTVVTRK